VVAPAIVLASVGGAPTTSGAATRTVVANAPAVRVAVVIDFGPSAKMSPRIVIKCPQVPAGTNGEAVLADVADSFHVPVPTYADSGLLCSIDGYPSTGCGTLTSSGYVYWSYWHGGQHWSYSNVGAASWTVTNGDVEGWRFEDQGAGAGDDPAPALSSDFATICADATTHPAPAPSNGPPGGSATLLAVVALVMLALGGGAASGWRRRSARDED
jgi:hypothetical protein